MWLSLVTASHASVAESVFGRDDVYVWLSLIGTSGGTHTADCDESAAGSSLISGMISAEGAVHRSYEGEVCSSGVTTFTARSMSSKSDTPEVLDRESASGAAAVGKAKAGSDTDRSERSDCVGRCSVCCACVSVCIV